MSIDSKNALPCALSGYDVQVSNLYMYNKRVNWYGPLVRYWCMRFEGKHNYFKDLAHRLKCFKNIPKSMAHHHQELMCYYVNGSRDRSPFYKEDKVSNIHFLQ